MDDNTSMSLPPPAGVTLLRNATISASVIIIIAGAIWLLFAPEYGDGLASIIFLLLIMMAGALFVVHAMKDAVKRINEAPQPAAPIAAQPAPAGVIPVDAQTGEGMFDKWVQNRLMYADERQKLSSSAAKDDYGNMCRGNGIQPVSDSKFYDLLKKWQEASGGAVRHEKVNGRMIYSGVRLAAD